MHINRNLPIVALSVLLTAFSGCTTQTAKKPVTSDKNSEEYVSHTSLGSRIPVRVKKSQVKSTDAESEQARDALSDAQRMGTTLPAGAER